MVNTHPDMVQAALADATLRTNPRAAMPPLLQNCSRSCYERRVNLRDDQTIRERVQAAGVVGAGGQVSQPILSYKRVLTLSW